MNRLLASFSAVAALAAVSQAQCFTNIGGTPQSGSMYSVWGGYPIHDEGRSILPIQLGFTFPMPTTAPGQVCNRIWVGSNGHVYLSDANYGLVAPIQFLIDTLGELRGAAFGSPRLVVYGDDIQQSPLGPWEIFVNTATANQVTITWQNVARYQTPTDQFNFSCTLYSNGNIDYSYDVNCPGNAVDPVWVGVSTGNAAGTGAEVASDLLSGANSGNVGILWGEYLGAFALSGKTLRFSPNGIGGYTTSVVCTGADHIAYGSGCYGPRASQAFYQYFGTPAGSATLAGNSMTMTPAGPGYLVSWGGGTYVAPTGGATTLALTDDSEVDVTPSIAFPTPAGPIGTLSVCSNGFVNMGGIGNNNVAAYGDVFELLNAVIPSFRSNADYDPAAGGAIKSQEVAGVFYVTWENVVRYNTTGVSDRWQLQFNLSSGEVKFVWDAMQNSAGIDMVVGYSPGLSLDPGSINLATTPSFLTQPDYNATQALALSASPAPIYTPGNPTVPVNYTVDNMIDLVPPLGIGLGILMFSVAPFPGGLDMGFLDMPGCNLNILSLDVTVPLPGTAPTASVTLTIPQPLSPGLSFYAQVLGLFTPFSLPNGQNAFGGLLSNGLRSIFNLY